jgi:hypothetical protein
MRDHTAGSTRDERSRIAPSEVPEEAKLLPEDEQERWSPPDPVECPRCRRIAGVVIVYGMPGADLFEAAEKNQLALGGCVIFEDQPDYRCRQCGHEWVDAAV